MDDRRDDWRNGVDQNLASLNAGQRVQDDKIQKLEDSHDELQADIHGEIDSGLIGRIEDVETLAAKLHSAVFMDASGKKGMQHDVQQLLEGREDKRDRRGNWTKVLVAIIGSGALGLFWHDIRTFLARKSTDPVDQMIETVKHPKSHHRHYAVTIPPDDDQ